MTAAAEESSTAELAVFTRAAESLLLAANSEAEVLAVAVALLGDRFGYGSRGVMLYDAERDDLYTAQAAGRLAEIPEVLARRVPMGRGIVGECAKYRRSERIADAPADPRYLRSPHGVRSLLCVPIVASDELLGVLAVESPEPAVFSERDELLVTSFSRLVALALVHARAHQGRRADLETIRRQYAELEAVHEIARRAASLDLYDALRAAVDAFQRLTTADSTAMYRYREDQNTLELAALTFDPKLYPSDYEERVRSVRIGVGEGLVGWVAEHREPLLIADVAKDPRSRSIPGIPLDGKSGIVAPVFTKDRLLGVIRAIKMGTNTFSQDHLRFARTLASQTALAIAAANAHREQSAHLEELGALYETSRKLTEAATLDEVLGVVLAGALELTDAQAGVIWRRAPDGSFALATSRNLDAEAVGAWPPDTETSLSTEMLRTGRTMLIDDIQQEGPRPRWKHTVPHLHAAIGVPLRSEGLVYGSLYVLHTRSAFFRPQHVRHLEVLAGHAASAFARAQAFEEARRLSITDELTGCYNARYFTARLREEVERARRYGQPLALVMLDSDSLKRVNDVFGHEDGNRHVVQVANAIRESVRSHDIVARFGGDEFLILQPSTELSAAVKTAERIRLAVCERPFVSSGGEGVQVSISGGVAAYPATAGGAEELFRQSDDALYLAKRHGKNFIASAPLATGRPVERSTI